MHLRLLKWSLITAGLLVLTACNPNQSPEEIRKKTAEDTVTLKRDTKAVAEGIKEGLTEKKSVDLNKASKDDLTALPGITELRAERIIAARPYSSAHELVTKRVVTQDEYARIQDRIAVSP